MWDVAAVLIILLGGAVAVVKYLRGAEAKAVALDERSAELNLEQQRVRQMEAAATAEREARRTRLRETAAAVHSADDAARLLRDVTGADNAEVN